MQRRGTRLSCAPHCQTRAEGDPYLQWTLVFAFAAYSYSITSATDMFEYDRNSLQVKVELHVVAQIDSESTE